MSENRIRLLLIADCLYGDGQGGSETQFLRTYRRSDQIGVSPFVIFLRDREIHHQIEWVSEPVTLDLLSLASPKLIMSLEKATRIIKDNNIQVMQSLFDDASLFTYLLKRLNPHVKFVCSQRNLAYARGAVKRHFFKIVYRSADRIIVNSWGISEMLENDYGVARSKIELIDNMHDVEKFVQIRKARTKSVLGRNGQRSIGVVVANFRPIKGIEDLLNALARLPTDLDIQILVAGDGPERNNYVRMIDQLKLSGKIQLLGYAPNVLELLAKAHFAVLPSRSEGGSNALAEYLLAGLPTVATNVGGNRDFLDDGEYGILVEPNDPASLCNGIQTIIRDYGEWHCAAQKGLNAAATRFSAKTVATKYERFYRSLV